MATVTAQVKGAVVGKTEKVPCPQCGRLITKGVRCGWHKGQWHVEPAKK
jgi:hypothetical protein